MFATHFASLSCTLTEAWCSTGDPTPSCWRSCTGSSSPPSSQSTSCTSPSWRWCPARSRRQSRARCASFRPSPWSTKWAERRLWEHRRSSSSSTPSPSSGRLGWVLKHLALWEVRTYLTYQCSAGSTLPWENMSKPPDVQPWWVWNNCIISISMFSIWHPPLSGKYRRNLITLQGNSRFIMCWSFFALVILLITIYNLNMSKRARWKNY